jgi:RNA polymerase primary sigma factor
VTGQAKRAAALADLRQARIEAWAATGHPDPEQALLEDTQRERARQRPPTPAERRATAAFAAANEPLIRSFAARYSLRHGDLIEDIRQEARIGLLKAIDRYDHRESSSFSTLAVWWLRSAVSRYLANTGAQIRIPVQAGILRNQIARDRAQHPNTTIRATAKRIGCTPAAVRRIDEIPHQPDPLPRLPPGDAGRGNTTDDPNAVDVAIPDPQAPDLDDLLDLTNMRRRIEKHLAHLDSRKRYLYQSVIVDEHTQREAAEALDCTRQRVQQLLVTIESDLRRSVTREDLAASARAVTCQ